MGSTNYANTFIQVAEDCPVTQAEVPPTRGNTPTVASLQYDLIAADPYRRTSDDVLFEVYALRQGIPEEEQADARAAFFAKTRPASGRHRSANATAGASITTPMRASPWWRVNPSVTKNWQRTRRSDS
ncbi:DUF6157 family protein [Tessaracoccus sp. HF-7]|nr:DUF6157 family protein [Tessaracoccus caeni]MDF1489896.1 DUF6157 family protein [Tessaracoccus caeni]